MNARLLRLAKKVVHEEHRWLEWEVGDTTLFAWYSPQTKPYGYPSIWRFGDDVEVISRETARVILMGVVALKEQLGE
jgi:hypothetical protein